MPRYKLTIEYAGTRYSGWQIQKNARTVQGELYRAVHVATGRDAREIYGAGRTDAGVHAIAQVAHLDLGAAIDPRVLRETVNDALPSDIVIAGCERTTPRFHARHSAVGRWYLYQIARRKTAFGKPFVWWVKDEIDLKRLQRAAERLRGRHDFQSFAHRSDDEASTLVEIDRVDVGTAGDLLLVRIAGSHFLWRMVRRLIGVLVAVGTGQLPPSIIDQLLVEPSSLPAQLTAPASGLFLERVFYEAEAADSPLRPVVRLG
jgi:tRNA pseudouridine38-40 synthase